MQAVQVVCRKATSNDIETLFELIKGYAEQGIMLPRTREALEYMIDTFVVAEIGEEVVGCGSLLRLGKELVEIRSLGMSDGYKGVGIGSKLVEALIEQAREQQIPKVMALTYAVSFLRKMASRSLIRKFSRKRFGRIASTVQSSLLAMK